MLILISLLMAIHGVAHIPGFLVSWQLAELAEMPYHTAVLGGALDLGDTGIRVLGIGWILAGAGFWVAAVGALTHQPWWVPLALGLAAVSLVLSIAEAPASAIGIGANLLLVGLIALAARGDALGVVAR